MRLRAEVAEVSQEVLMGSGTSEPRGAHRVPKNRAAPWISVAGR